MLCWHLITTVHIGQVWGKVGREGSSTIDIKHHTRAMADNGTEGASPKILPILVQFPLHWTLYTVSQNNSDHICYWGFLGSYCASMDDEEKVDEEPKSPPKTPTKDEMIHFPRAKRRGSTTFLTSDDNIVMAFGSGRRLSSFCTTSSYEWVFQCKYSFGNF